MSAAAPLPPAVDVAIVGGGMVGLSLAAILAAGGPGLSVAVIEAFPMAELEDGAAPAQQLPPSFDARASALSASSRQIYNQVGLWDEIAACACPISAIHVSDRGNPGATRMAAADNGLAGLGYVVENRVLGRVLHGAVRRRDNISLHSPLHVERLVPTAEGMEIRTGERSCTAGLVVAAGGADSVLLQGLGIHTETSDYGQTALIANLALAEPHGGVAYERFTDEGPIALLPLPDTEHEHRAALVWTLPPEQAEAMAAAGEEEFLEKLHRRFGFRAGRFVRGGARAVYPLKLMLAEEQVRRHLVIAGNAAHFLHPVAGQGFNLALRDVARLAEHLLAAAAAGKRPGELAVLEAYLAKQRRDQRSTIRFSHNLPGFFADPSPVTTLVRNAGLIGLDLLQPLRRGFASFGAGLANPGTRLSERG